MRYASGSIQILKLVQVEGSFGLSCRAHCPNCGSLHVLRSKFYESDGVDELRPALRDLCAVVRCVACNTRSDFVLGALWDDLSSAKVTTITKKRSHRQALNPVVMILQRPATRPQAYWQIQPDSLALNLQTSLVHRMAVPALVLSSTHTCQVCCASLDICGMVHLGFAGKTELPPQGTWPLTARWYVHFRHIGVELMARTTKEYLCTTCQTQSTISSQAKTTIQEWLDLHLTLDWLDARMKALPGLQKTVYESFLERSSGLSDHLLTIFSQEMLLTPHALRDWHYQLEEFERNARELAGIG